LLPVPMTVPTEGKLVDDGGAQIPGVHEPE
jgi:hypothetical protein